MSTGSPSGPAAGRREAVGLTPTNVAAIRPGRKSYNTTSPTPGATHGSRYRERLSVRLLPYRRVVYLFAFLGLHFDGNVDASDFAMIGINFGMTLPAPSLGAIIPEPSGLISIVGSALLRRRRRR